MPAGENPGSQRGLSGYPMGPQDPTGTPVCPGTLMAPYCQSLPSTLSSSFFLDLLLLASFPTPWHDTTCPPRLGSNSFPSRKFLLHGRYCFHQRCGCLPSARPQHFIFTSLKTRTSVPYIVGTFEHMSSPTTPTPVVSIDARIPQALNTL